MQKGAVQAEGAVTTHMELSPELRLQLEGMDGMGMVTRGEQWALQPLHVRPLDPLLVRDEISTLGQHTLTKHTFSLLLHSSGSRSLAASLRTPTWRGLPSPFPSLSSSNLPAPSSGYRGAAEFKLSVCPPAAADRSSMGLVSYCTFFKNSLQPTVLSCKC